MDSAHSTPLGQELRSEGIEVGGWTSAGLPILLLLWASLLFGLFFWNPGPYEAENRVPRWARMASSATLVVAGGLGWWLVRRTPAATFGGAIAIGMAWGFLGDLFNASIIPLPEPILGGIVAFGIGHLFYIGGCLDLARRGQLDAPIPRYAAILFWQVFAIVGWLLIVAPIPERGPVYWGSLPYSMLLAGTAGLMCGFALQQGRFFLLGLGGVLFLVSDLILAVRLFHPETRDWLTGDAVWLTYGPGQMMIVYSIPAAGSLFNPATRKAPR